MQKYVATFAMALFMALSPGAQAQFPASFDDAPLHTVTFVDAQEGWAAGDAGTIWHTTDGGKNWERQKSGTRASLRALQFLTPYTGYAVGRAEQPYGLPATGVVLKTTDGGLTWLEVAAGILPALHTVHFTDDKTGLAMGDGASAFPSGAFRTTDGGETWTVVPGPKVGAWFAMISKPGLPAMAVGTECRMATVTKTDVDMANTPPWGGRTLRAMASGTSFDVVVGDGGLISVSQDGKTWLPCELPTVAKTSVDLLSVTSRGSSIWAVGKPGSCVFHSPDAGKTWVMMPTGQTMTLNAIHMVNNSDGIAVGELGTILATADGGKTWQTRKCGGQRAAVMVAVARAENIPLDAIALLGAKDGYYCTSLVATSPRAEAVAAATRSCGGVAGTGLWMFPAPKHLEGISAAAVLAYWDTLHGGNARQELVRQMVMAIRTWKPELIISDSITSDKGIDQAIALAMQEAVKQAADPKAFPELKADFGLEVHVCKTVVASTPVGASTIVWDHAELNTDLGNDVRDFCELGVNLLGSRAAVPAKRGFTVQQGDRAMKTIDSCLSFARGGSARRAGEMTKLPEAYLAQRKTFAETRRSIEKLAGSATGDQGDKVLAAVRKSLTGMPEDVACRTAFHAGEQLVQAGQWGLSREVYAFVADQFAAHPEAAVAARWLVAYHSSGEVQRRMELGQVNPLPARIFDPVALSGIQMVGNTEASVGAKTMYRFASADAQRVWYRYAVDLEAKLLVHGPLHAKDPFVLAALGVARERGAIADRPAIARMTLPCQRTVTRPKLDAFFDDQCWKEAQPIKMEGPKDYTTAFRFSHDNEFLYVAIEAAHPAGMMVPATKNRGRDSNLIGHDRVELSIDLDGDDCTAFQFAIDHRGEICDECWGDRKWNPKWFVAFEPDKTGWKAELAIPMSELSGAKVDGQVWRIQTERVVPGVGAMKADWLNIIFAK